MAKPDQAHGKGQEKQAQRVYRFAGDDEYPAGEVRIVHKATHGMVSVQPVDGSAAFETKRDHLTPVGGDDEGQDAG